MMTDAERGHYIVTRLDGSDDPGICSVTRLTDPPRLHIDRADPKILIAAELLEQIRDGHLDPYISFDGEVLRISGDNQTVVYRITDYEHLRDIYHAEWPD